VEERLYRNFEGETGISRDDREIIMWLDIIELAQHKEHS
jgi:hypothetical protein